MKQLHTAAIENEAATEEKQEQKARNSVGLGGKDMLVVKMVQSSLWTESMGVKGTPIMSIFKTKPSISPKDSDRRLPLRRQTSQLGCCRPSLVEKFSVNPLLSRQA